MTDAPEVLAARLVALTFIGERVRLAERATRTAIAEAWAVSKREPVELAAGPDGVPVNVGSVRLDKGATSAFVTDMDALIAWCEDNFTDALETITRRQIRSSNLSAILDQAKKDGLAVAASGELIPGIEVLTGKAKVVVTGAKTVEQQAAVMDAIRVNGAIGSLLAVTDGSEQ